MSERTIKYFDDSYAQLIYVEDGIPMRYCCLGPPTDQSGEPALAARIFELTGKRVRFGTWITLQGDPRDGGAEVELIVID